MDSITKPECSQMGHIELQRDGYPLGWSFLTRWFTHSQDRRSQVGPEVKVDSATPSVSPEHHHWLTESRQRTLLGQSIEEDMGEAIEMSCLPIYDVIKFTAFWLLIIRRL